MLPLGRNSVFWCLKQSAGLNGQAHTSSCRDIFSHRRRQILRWPTCQPQAGRTCTFFATSMDNCHWSRIVPNLWEPQPFRPVSKPLAIEGRVTANRTSAEPRSARRHYDDSPTRPQTILIAHNLFRRRLDVTQRLRPCTACVTTLWVMISQRLP